MFTAAVLCVCGGLFSVWIRKLCQLNGAHRGKIGIDLLSGLMVGAASAAHAQRNPGADPPTACDLQASEIPGKTFGVDKEHDKLVGDTKLVSEASKRLAAVLQIVKESWPAKKVFEAKYHRVLLKDAPEAVAPYNFYSVLVTYQCQYKYDSKTNNYTPSGTFITPKPDTFMFDYTKAFTLHIGINSVRDLFTSEMRAHVDGRMRTIYQTADYVEDIDGVRVYGVPRLGKRKIMHFGRPGAQPFLPNTQRQYMNALLEHSEDTFGTPSHPGTFKGSFSQQDVDAERADMRRYLAEASEAELNSQPRHVRRLVRYMGLANLPSTA